MTITEILKEWHAYQQGTKVVNCVQHMHLNISARPPECLLCNTDMQNFIDGAIGVNNFLNETLLKMESAEPEPEVDAYRRLATYTVEETGRVLEIVKGPVRPEDVRFWDGYLVALQQFGEWLGVPSFDPVLQKVYSLDVPGMSKWAAAGALADMGYNVHGYAIEFASLDSLFHNWATVPIKRVERKNIAYEFKSINIGNVIYLACDKQGLWLTVRNITKKDEQ